MIELNESAHRLLPKSQIEIIPDAGHLFEEPGALDAVTELVVSWSNTHVAQNTSSVTKSISTISDLAKPFESTKHLKELIDHIKDKQVVMLGESTHGTEEYYLWRKLISQILINDHGFNFIAVEGDWPDCLKLNRFAQLQDASTVRGVVSHFTRWPTWMWANEQVADLMNWLRARNTWFYGLDIYSLFPSLDEVKYLSRKLGPLLKKQVEKAYSCFDSFQRSEINYANSVARGGEGCEAQTEDTLKKLLRLRQDETTLNKEELLNLQQNARLIRNAERYYRTMNERDSTSWNIRDTHMMETLEALLQFHGKDAKAIIWAHNTHIGDYHATDMNEAGYVNLGGLARERLGMSNVALVGFGTYEGQVLAGPSWEAPAEITQIRPAREGSYEDIFHKIAQEKGASQFFMILDGESLLKEKHDHRAIGVVYQTSYEQGGRNYVPTSLSERYDAFIFFDKTHPLKAFVTDQQDDVLPETWPVGL